MGGSCSTFLFQVEDEFNRLSKHNCNFKLTQSIRLLFMVCSLAIWACLLYVWVKAIFAQLQFYILTIYFYAISVIAFSSGREVVEVKILDKMKQELRNKNEDAEKIDQVELPSDEKSAMWKRGLIAYSIATPLIFASPVMFLIFKSDMMRGEVCKFYELAHPDDKAAQDDCLYGADGYASRPDYFQEQAGFRYQAFLISLIMPCVFFFIEFSMNQLLMKWKHLVYQYVFTAFYVVITAVWQVSTGDAVIFPNQLDWNADDLWTNCIRWFMIFASVQTGCFSIILFAHYLKSKYCCRRSVRIIPVPEFRSDIISKQQ